MACFKKLALVGMLGLFAVAGTAGVSGCGSDDTNAAAGGGNVDAGEGTGNATTDTLTTQSDINTLSFTVAGQALAAGMASLSAPPALVKAAVLTESVYDCSESGTATYSGEFTENSENDFTMILNVLFDDCDGLNGEIDETVDVAYTDESNFSYAFSISGEIGGNGCLVEYDAFTLNIGFTGTVSFTVDGSFTSTCGSDSVTCEWNNVNVLEDSEAYAAGCTAS